MASGSMEEDKIDRIPNDVDQPSNSFKGNKLKHD